jgi:hypothetical protein
MSQTARAKNAYIRTWLRANGYEVGNMGRIPKKLMAIFNAAHES